MLVIIKTISSFIFKLHHYYSLRIGHLDANKIVFNFNTKKLNNFNS